MTDAYKIRNRASKNYSNLILRSDEELASTNDKEYTKKLIGGVFDAKY